MYIAAGGAMWQGLQDRRIYNEGSGIALVPTRTASRVNLGIFSSMLQLCCRRMPRIQNMGKRLLNHVVGRANQTKLPSGHFALCSSMLIWMNHIEWFWTIESTFATRFKRMCKQGTGLFIPVLIFMVYGTSCGDSHWTVTDEKWTEWRDCFHSPCSFPLLRPLLWPFRCRSRLERGKRSQMVPTCAIRKQREKNKELDCDSQPTAQRAFALLLVPARP